MIDKFGNSDKQKESPRQKPNIYQDDRWQVVVGYVNRKYGEEFLKRKGDACYINDHLTIQYHDNPALWIEHEGIKWHATIHPNYDLHWDMTLRGILHPFPPPWVLAMITWGAIMTPKLKSYLYENKDVELPIIKRPLPEPMNSSTVQHMIEQVAKSTQSPPRDDLPF